MYCLHIWLCLPEAITLPPVTVSQIFSFLLGSFEQGFYHSIFNGSVATYFIIFIIALYDIPQVLDDGLSSRSIIFFQSLQIFLLQILD